MTVTDAAPRPLLEPSAVLDDVAARLADGAPLGQALGALAAGFGLRGALLSGPTGELLALAGEVLSDVPPDKVLVLPVPGPCGIRVATLTAVGSRPSQLAALRTAASVVGLAMAGDRAGPVFDSAEQANDELADALHDGPVQTLVAARYAADAVVRGGDPVAARDAVQRALVELRFALWHLRPRGRGGLGAALNSLSSQLSAAGAPALVMVGPMDRADNARGAAAVTAFRLVQSIARPAWPAVHVAVRVEAPHGVPLLVVCLNGGAPLAAAERWTCRARAVGGDLTCAEGRLRLALPIPDPRTAP